MRLGSGTKLGPFEILSPAGIDIGWCKLQSFSRFFECRSLENNDTIAINSRTRAISRLSRAENCKGPAHNGSKRFQVQGG
jgi:hypothetical protein